MRAVYIYHKVEKDANGHIVTRVWTEAGDFGEYSLLQGFGFMHIGGKRLSSRNYKTQAGFMRAFKRQTERAKK